MSGTVSCPPCGHVLFAIELPIALPVQARDVSPPDAPLLLRVAEKAGRRIRPSRRSASRRARRNLHPAVR
jgi:hypothetical protein